MRPCEASQIEGHNSHIGCHAFSQCDVYSNLSIPMRQRLMEPCLSPSKLSHRHGSILGIAPVGLAGLDPRGRRAHPMGEGGGSEACRVGPRSLGSSGSLVALRNRPLARSSGSSELLVYKLTYDSTYDFTNNYTCNFLNYKMIYNFTYNSAYNFTYTSIQFYKCFTNIFTCNPAHKLYIYFRL